MADPLAHWNDILTILAFAVAATTGYFQIQDFRKRPAQPSLIHAINPEFRSRSLGESDGLREASFNFSVEMENKGRNGFSVSRVTLTPQHGDPAEVELQDGEQSDATQFDGHASRELSFRGTTTLPNSHPDEIVATIEVETPAGNDSLQTTFTCLERR
ncbi:hypothetical protein [Halobacterium salinarum]|uniref:hypothetical protein n=1 Tax=Halobacterium salinarum TaxID=2242 RepID=UPI002555FDCE|nr:hypothetical protein [Halobacterium salinarum]MDL0142530.1 hypothetical protein [Halobacterium salinarum]